MRSHPPAKNDAAFNAGRKLGWFLAAAFDTTCCLPRMRRDVAGHHKVAQSFLHGKPDVTHMEKDAMRHAYVSAKMTQCCGPSHAAFLGYCNEAIRDVTNTNDCGNRGMDLYNNAVGRRIAQDNPGIGDDALLDLVWTSARDGTLVTDTADPRIAAHSYCHDNDMTSPVFEKIKQVSDVVYRPFNRVIGFFR